MSMPGREPALSNLLCARLAAGVEGQARRVVVGLNWTFVEGPAGAGLAHTPARGTAGCLALPEPGSYSGRALSELAALTESANVFDRAIGVAAINAHWNRYDLEGGPENGLDLAAAGSDSTKGEGTVVIGRFPALAKRLPGALVIEREPRPGEYPETAAGRLLPRCSRLVVTASALEDGSLGRLLALAPNAFTMLIGPGTPLSERLFGHGVDTLSGLVVVSPERIACIVAEGGSVSALKPHSRYVTLQRC